MYHIRKQACGSTTAPKEQIYISPAASFGRVMLLMFAHRLKRAFIIWPVLFGAGCSDGTRRGCSRTQMAQGARPKAAAGAGRTEVGARDNGPSGSGTVLRVMQCCSDLRTGESGRRRAVAVGSVG